MESIKQALVKKAQGYFYDEVVQEMGFDNLTSQMIIVKQKVTKKHMPPDTTAMKMLLDENPAQMLESLTKEELELEKQELLKRLKENENECKKTIE